MEPVGRHRTNYDVPNVPPKAGSESGFDAYFTCFFFCFRLLLLLLLQHYLYFLIAGILKKLLGHTRSIDLVIL